MIQQERAYRQGAIERDATIADANQRDNRERQARLDAELSDHPLAGEAETDR
jgi:hypothetical protein